ncbi:MAG: hypothetical protein ACLSCV_09340 [Acutalibacteraceae bacterium]
MIWAGKVLGRGDMLFAPWVPKAACVQGCYVDDREIESIVNFVKIKPSEYDQSVIEGIEKNAVAEKSKGDEVPMQRAQTL